MLTDNAVVVVDNIYRHVQEEEKDVKKASFVRQRSFSSILTSTLTSVIVFLPIVFTGRNYEGNVSRDGLGDYFFQILPPLSCRLT